MRPIAVLRPEPGNGQTAERVRAAGLSAIQLPLFEVVPVEWQPPAIDRFYALLLTSANALHQGGALLQALTTLPVLAVGNATADAARAAGFHVKRTGDNDAAELLRDVDAGQRLLWLSGVERTPITHRAIRHVIPVYRSVARAIEPDEMKVLTRSVAFIHSARAGERLAELIDFVAIDRRTVRIAAISHKAARAAGPGWDRIATSSAPNDAALIATAHALAIDP